MSDSILELAERRAEEERLAAEAAVENRRVARLIRMDSMHETLRHGPTPTTSDEYNQRRIIRDRLIDLYKDIQREELEVARKLEQKERQAEYEVSEQKRTRLQQDMFDSNCEKWTKDLLVHMTPTKWMKDTGKTIFCELSETTIKPYGEHLLPLFPLCLAKMSTDKTTFRFVRWEKPYKTSEEMATFEMRGAVYQHTYFPGKLFVEVT
jgi:hypothetical protein